MLDEATYGQTHWSQYMGEQYSYQPVCIYFLTATDLILDAKKDVYLEAYVLTIGQAEDLAQVLWCPSTHRLGIAWRVDTTWATVEDLESGIEMYVNDPDEWIRRGDCHADAKSFTHNR